MNYFLLRSLVLALLIVGIVGAAATPKTAELPDRGEADAAIRGLIARYAESVDAADIQLASTIWANTPDVSFIHPRGHEHG
jgi:hypothetical protein